VSKFTRITSYFVRTEYCIKTYAVRVMLCLLLGRMMLASHLAYSLLTCSGQSQWPTLRELIPSNTYPNLQSNINIDTLSTSQNLNGV
jgi:hypothetical protein